MRAKIISIQKQSYIPAPYSGKNDSGCIPLGDRVLVRPDIAMSQTHGGVELPDDVRERAQLSGSTGVIIETGEDAFVWNGDRTRPWQGYKPVAGDRIYYDRYAGKVILGSDGVEYRLMDDVAIGGVQKRNDA